MANRYWVGGTASWDATAGTKWATTSGGAGGASVPTSADDVFFDANSGAGTVTIATGNTGALSIDCTGFTGTLSHSANITVGGSVTLVAEMTFNNNFFTTTFTGTGTLTTAGKTYTGVTLNGSGITLTLGSALTSNGAITVTQGTFTTSNYNVTATSLSSSNTNTRTINLGSSTVTLTASGALSFATNTNLTFNAGTSQINVSNGGATVSGGTGTGAGVTFYNLSFTGIGTGTTRTVTGVNTFNNLSVAGPTSAGILTCRFSADQTINGTLTLSAGANATCRVFINSDTIGTARTLTCAAVASLTDIDFRDITIAGAAAPVSGTRLGDCKGNSGISFSAPKTVYWAVLGGFNWGDSTNTWSFTNGGSGDVTAFPLAQDTAVFPSNYPDTSALVTINAAYNIGTIDMSARTSKTMTLATGTTTPTIYGNWINGTGTTLTGTGLMTFAGRGSQTITSAGKTFTQLIQINAFGGSVTLQDAFTSGSGSASAMTLRYGTFDTNGYNVTIPGGFNTNFTDTRSLNIRSSTLSIAGSGNAWNASSSTGLTVSGTGTISLTSASGKNFIGGDIQTYPTLNQGGTGTLTVIGSNKFKGLTNTAIGRIQFTGGTTNIFDSFTISGALGNLLPLGSTNTTQATLQKSTAWQMGLLSTDSGNNTNLSFVSSDGTMEYLNVSYIKGTVVAPPATSTGNFFFFF